MNSLELDSNSRNSIVRDIDKSFLNLFDLISD